MHSNFVRLALFAFTVAITTGLVLTTRPSRGSTHDIISSDPASACKACFVSGVPPSNISSPLNGKLVPLCHTKGSEVFFYTVYDPSVFHASISAMRIRSSVLSKCVGGRRAFELDPQLKALGVSQINPESASSGYDGKWNRGHLGPSELFSYDKSSGGAWQQCYFTTNIAPQWYQFNQIGWRLLELNIFNWSVRNKKDIFVITGTWYNTSKLRKFSSGLAIPNYYYKVICDGSSSAAFAGSNIENSSGMEAMAYMTVNSWQSKTGIYFNLPSGCNTNSINPQYWNFTHEPALLKGCNFSDCLRRKSINTKRISSALGDSPDIRHGSLQAHISSISHLSIDIFPENMMNNIDQLRAESEKILAVERLRARDITPEDFARRYLSTNTPVILTGLADTWFPCSKDWTFTNADGKFVINWEYLGHKFGECAVTAALCNERAAYGDQPRESITLKNFIEYMTSKDRSSKPMRYVKDWHLWKYFEEKYGHASKVLYDVPHFFRDDWLEDYCLKYTNDDYRFVYVGPVGSWTPLHTDVLRSYSWSYNVAGIKEWLLFPPSMEPDLVDKDGIIPFNVRAGGFDLSRCIRVLQAADEVIYIPSGWWHEVHNLEDTLSINQNWFNGYSVDLSARYLIQRLKACALELQDLKPPVIPVDDYRQALEGLLEADSGFSLAQFVVLLDLAESGGSRTLFEVTRISEVRTLLHDASKPLNSG